SMKKRLIIVSTALAFTSGVLLMAQSSRSAEIQFKAAQQREVIEGDLKGAIKEYERLAKGKDRALAAQALLRMAECYQKLGSADARRTYERLVREFADQTQAVAIARSHL